MTPSTPPASSETGGYLPVDLTGVRNAPVDVFDDPHEVTLGDRALHGIPFRFGSPDDAVVLVPSGGSATVPLDRQATWVIVAHAVLETDLYEGGSVGDAVGRYTLRYADGSTHATDIRQRFEIGPTPRKWDGRPLPLDWGQTPFLAVNDAEHELIDRTCGRFDEAGARFVDIEDAQSRVPYVLPYRFYLWAMPNPRPDLPLASIELSATGHTLLVGAVTTSDLHEDPFTRDAARNVVIEIVDPGRHGQMDERIEVTVDRGSSTYVYRTTPLYDDDPDATGSHLALPPGFGRAKPETWSTGYARISANPSATIEIGGAEGAIGSFRWGDLLERGELTNGGVRVRLPDAGQAWVRLRVRGEDGHAVPCRIRFQTVDGIPLAPYGHHAHINSDGGTWNLDIGGDVRLGADTSAFIDGRGEGWLPIGEVDVEITRGFEYRPVRRRLVVTATTEEIAIELPRLFDSRGRGYLSGDTHVHFVSSQGAELEASAEDVGVANLLLTQWGHLFTSTEEFVGRPQTSADGRTVVFAGQENRTNMLGHINLLGLREPIMPWCTGGSEEAELGGGLETTLSHWADECRAQGGTVVLAHFPVPYGETAALLATGRLDAVETIAYDDYNIREYYRYLNAGYRIPLVAGTDKMTSEVPIGLMRTYSGTRDGEPAEVTDYWDWCDGIRRGDTMSSSGPLLWLTVDGARPGSTLTALTGPVEASVELETVFPVEFVEIIQDGVVVHREPMPAGASRHRFSVPVDVTASSWIAARCQGTDDLRHTDTWSRPVFSHTSPVYVTPDEEWEMFDEAVVRSMLAIVDGARRYITERARVRWPGAVRHRHGEDDHLGYLSRPLDEATDALERRLAVRALH
jgi:hypothetical protein